MRVIVIIPPAPVVTLERAKQHLRVDAADDDALIAAMIAAVTNHLDGPQGWLGRSLGIQTLEARFSIFDLPRRLVLPFPPSIELVSVKYLGVDDVERVADLEDLELLGAEIVPAGSMLPWEGCSVRREAIRVRYKAGYAELPPAIAAAILLMVGDLYANREGVIAGASAAAIAIPMSTTAEALLGPFRVFR